MAEFDRIADVYDETRDPLPPSVLTTVEAMLTETQCHRVLEIGVGTGRVAKPLADAGWAMYGADLSGGMLRKAHAKGLRELVRADAARLPYRAESFDATLMTHVLHVFRDPSAVLQEASRVSRRRVVVIVNQRAMRDPGSTPPERRQRELFYQLRAERGYPVPPERRRHWWRERALLRQVPPSESRIVELPASPRNWEDWMRGMHRRAYSLADDLPDGVLNEILEEMRRRLPAPPTPRPRSTVVAMWRPSQLREVPPLTAGGEGSSFPSGEAD
jgi:SAM-dependent methyltransferase